MLIQQHHCECGHTFLAARETKMLGGGRFDIDPVLTNLQVVRNIFLHDSDIGRQLGRLRNDGEVRVTDAQSL